MAGNKTSGNPYSIPINYDREIGEPIIYAIRRKGYGKGTYAGMVLMQNLKDEIFAYWKEKGEDPQALWDKWFPKWSMNETEQKEMNNQKAKESHNQLVKQYEALGETCESAENLASLFPDGNPLDILRGKNYNIQNKPIENTIEAKNGKEIARLENELIPVNGELKRAEEFLVKNPDKKGNVEPRIAQLRERKAELEARITQLR